MLPVIRDHAYHPAFAGSYSLKSVLPALVPEMSYAGLEVADGQAAGLAWESLVRGELNWDERDGIAEAERVGYGFVFPVEVVPNVPKKRQRRSNRKVPATGMMVNRMTETMGV